MSIKHNVLYFIFFSFILLLNEEHSFAGEHPFSFNQIQRCIGWYKSSKLLDEEVSAIRDYTGESFRTINECLKIPTKCTPEIEKKINLLNQALLKLPDFRKKVYREITVSAVPILKRYKEGSYIREDTFLSTSESLYALALENEDLNPWNSLIPIRLENFKDNPTVSVLFEIDSKSGKKIKKFSHQTHEEEILFQSGRLFYVQKIGKSSHGIQIKLQEVL